MAISDEWISDLIVTLITLVYVMLSVMIPKMLTEKNVISKFFARKLIHSFAGLAIFAAPFLNHPIIAGIIAFIMALATRKSGEKSKIKTLRELFRAISEHEELAAGYLQGPFAYSLAITLLVIIFTMFPDKYYFPISATLIMMFADTGASIFGKKYGKHHINVPWVGSKRTLEGSLAFFILAIIVSFPTFMVLGSILPGHSMVLTIGQILIFTGAISLASTLLELISPSKYDDLIVPLGTTLVISLIAVIMQVW